MFPEPFKEFLGLLEERGVRYLIVGGYAVAAHGYPRYTGDLDIFVAVDPDQAKAIVAAFREFGFSDLAISPEDFLEPDTIVEIGREPLKIQVMTGVSGVRFDECHPARTMIELGGRKRPFISYQHLLLNKSATRRPRDRVDVEERQDVVVLVHAVTRDLAVEDLVEDRAHSVAPLDCHRACPTKNGPICTM